jgi:hypothetical protein
MRWSSRSMVCLMTLVVLCPGLGLVSTAIAWTLRFAPPDHTTHSAAPFVSSTSVLVSPQFLRILVTGNQIILGIETPYMRAMELTLPIDLQRSSGSTSSTLPSAVTLPASRTTHDLRGPEALLLHGPQTIVGTTLP